MGSKIGRGDTPSGHGASPSYQVLRESIASFKLEDRPDSVNRRWSLNGRFTMKSTYSMLNDGGLKDGRSSKIWRIRIPLKVKVFNWIVLKKRPLTANNLLKRGWIGNTVCVLCGTEEETIDHLFVQCVFSRFLMVMNLENARLGNSGDNVTTIWDRWMTTNRSQSSCTSISELIACWWIIWEVRNGVIFRKTQPDPIQAVHKIKQVVEIWDLALPGRR
uniref:Reverse transcriptase zinc-binding domain-containing protein n=1 Tax=Ananas comosus var. bracteatus TaxID=296719 RepID=A0A6V7QN04_ANACO|nr:unnamed protein product [Ananas comosus var. bracteatus]